MKKAKGKEKKATDEYQMRKVFSNSSYHKVYNKSLSVNNTETKGFAVDVTKFQMFIFSHNCKRLKSHNFTIKHLTKMKVTESQKNPGHH